MAPKKWARPETEEKSGIVNDPDGTYGTGAALATRGKAKAAGNLDVIRAGNAKDEADGKLRTEDSEPLGQGLRVEEDKAFQLNADEKPQGIVRVYDSHPDNKDEDIVLFSGTREQLKKVIAQGQKHLGK